MRTSTIRRSQRAARLVRPDKSNFVMAAIILTLGFYTIWPIGLLLVNSFNVAPDMFVAPRVWGLDNWRVGFQDPLLLRALANTFLIWGLTAGISFPVAVVIAWFLARTRIPFSHGLEYMFWVAYMTPGGAVAWILMMDADVGMLNVFLEQLPFVDKGPFNIYSVPGIVWTSLMGSGIALKVMLLTPAFRNMDASLEEAARVGGASNLSTMLRVTLPLMVSPMALVLALQMLRIFQSFETEFLLGTPVGFYVYSTLIYEMVAGDGIPQYGQATVLASLTLLVIALIIPLQRWIIQRRRYTTITGSFRPGLVDLGSWKWFVFGMMVLLHLTLTLFQVFSLLLGSFMTRAGYFNISPIFTLDHWAFVLTDNLFLTGLRTTITLATTAAIISPILFSVLAYVLVRTRWRGRVLLDSIIWVSAAIPGLLAGLGLLMLFLGTPILSLMFGTIWALVLVVVIQGKTTGTNITKGVFVQIGQDMEDAARISGAGWFRTYFRIWIPLLMPTLVLLGTLNFVSAAGATSSIILLADRATITLSIIVLEFASPSLGLREEASIVSLLIAALTLGIALVARQFGLKMGVRHDR